MSIFEELRTPERKRVILDTDTYNEIDDQFALALALVSTDKIDLACVTAAPFHNENSDSYADGMERSYREIGICSALVKESHGTEIPPYYRGSTERMPDEFTPVESEAAHKIAEYVMAYDGITYVVAIGAITNVSSAILLHPEIKDKIRVIWLGGHARWYNGNEFNLQGDRNAANALFSSSVPLLLFPCHGVVSHVTTTVHELGYFLKGNSPLGDYLYDNVAKCKPAGVSAWSRVIWDVTTICAIISPVGIDVCVQKRPYVAEDYTYVWDKYAGECEAVNTIYRDPVLSIMYDRLRK